jgi:hypothetical protein
MATKAQEMIEKAKLARLKTKAEVNKPAIQEVKEPTPVIKEVLTQPAGVVVSNTVWRFTANPGAPFHSVYLGKDKTVSFPYETNVTAEVAIFDSIIRQFPEFYNKRHEL